MLFFESQIFQGVILSFVLLYLCEFLKLTDVTSLLESTLREDWGGGNLEFYLVFTDRRNWTPVKRVISNRPKVLLNGFQVGRTVVVNLILPS